MNKSLVLKNRIYLFFFLLFSFLIFLYLTYLLVNGERGIISYFKTKNQEFLYQEKLNLLIQKNEFLEDRISRLKTNTLDEDFLDEKIRLKTGYIDQNELIVVFED